MSFGLLPSILKVVIVFVIFAILIYICVRLSHTYLNYINKIKRKKNHLKPIPRISQ